MCAHDAAATACAARIGVAVALDEGFDGRVEVSGTVHQGRHLELAHAVEVIHLEAAIEAGSSRK